ncbi:MAG: hypothetical protein Q8M58_04785 [Anaerolineales bacterium]|nr:hypothetical protein [Anaerolineales bacterium]
MDTEKKLKLMRFWLVGVFAILFAGLFAFFYMWSAGVMSFALGAVWRFWLISAVLCVAAYYFYKWYLGRKK